MMVGVAIAAAELGALEFFARGYSDIAGSMRYLVSLGLLVFMHAMVMIPCRLDAWMAKRHERQHVSRYPSLPVAPDPPEPE